MVPLIVALLATPLQAACPAGAAETGDLAGAAVAAYEQLDVERFQVLVDELDQAVDCLGEPVGTETAASVHLAFALDAWTRRDEEQVHAALRALITLQPEYQAGQVLAPEGSGMAAALDQARWSGPGRVQSFPGVALVVDGQHSSSLPVERAALVQWTGTTGQLHSRYDWDGALGAELVATSTISGAPKLPAADRRQRSRGLALAGAATGIVALVGARQANQAYSAFEQTDSWSDARRLYTQNRVYAIGSGVAAAGTAGLAIGAVVVWEW